MNTEKTLRRDLIETCRQMASVGLTFGTSGNASVRLDDTSFLITPTGVGYDSLKPEDIVSMTLDGEVSGPRSPSSEWRFHRDILRARGDVSAIVHTHSPVATALACQRKEIPSFHYMVAVAGGDSIRCAPYATFGSQQLSNYVLDALEGRTACLMANHGQLAVGETLEAALKMAGEVETLANMYWHAQQGGAPVLLEATEMADVVEKFKTYGRETITQEDEEQEK